MKKTKTCCICGKPFVGWGNNPAPVKDRGECCDNCNSAFVIPARLVGVQTARKTTEYDRKAAFVKEYLAPMLKAARIDVADVEYRNDKPYGEVVKVTYTCGNAVYKNVGGDSLIALVRDVVKGL